MVVSTSCWEGHLGAGGEVLSFAGPGIGIHSLDDIVGIVRCKSMLHRDSRSVYNFILLLTKSGRPKELMLLNCGVGDS